MATTLAQDELYTVLENVSGVAKTFSFIGPRGMRLAAGEVVAVPGDLRATLGAMTQAGGKRRKFDALERAVTADPPLLRINSVPSPILFDSVDEVPVSLAVAAGVLGTVDPTYRSSDSASFASV